MALGGDLNKLNIKDIAAWPATFQLAILLATAFVVVTIGYFALLQGQQDELQSGKDTEEQLKTEYTDKKKQAVNLDDYKRQVAEVKQTFDVLLKQLPRKSEMDTLLNEINQAGVGRDLVIDSFTPQAEQVTTEMVEVPIQLSVLGRYHDLAAFASDISRLSRIVTLNDIDITDSGIANPKDTSGRTLLSMKTMAKTYRYLDEDDKAKMKSDQKKTGQ